MLQGTYATYSAIIQTVLLLKTCKIKAKSKAFWNSFKSIKQVKIVTD